MNCGEPLNNDDTPRRTTEHVVPELIDDNDFRSERLTILDHAWTTKTVRPHTVLQALMEAAPDTAVAESVEECSVIHLAVAYAAECLSAEDTFVLNAKNSEDITFEELGERLGLSRTQSWRLYRRATHRLRYLLLNHPPVRERLGMQPSWNSAAMQELIAIAGYDEGPIDGPPRAYVAAITGWIANAVVAQDEGKEMIAVRALTLAGEEAVSYLRSVGKWKLLDMHTLLCSKQSDYGHGNITKFGMVGVMVRASDKAERLKNLVTHRDGVAPRNESLLDTFYDVVGYAVIARMLKAETFELALETSLTSESFDPTGESAA